VAVWLLLDSGVVDAMLTAPIQPCLHGWCVIRSLCPFEPRSPSPKSWDPCVARYLLEWLLTIRQAYHVLVPLWLFCSLPAASVGDASGKDESECVCVVYLLLHPCLPACLPCGRCVVQEPAHPWRTCCIATRKQCPRLACVVRPFAVPIAFSGAASPFACVGLPWVHTHVVPSPRFALQ
jgi:hypothetical protein